MMPTQLTRPNFGAGGAITISIVDKYRYVREQEF
jgi:hypothetical protein